MVGLVSFAAVTFDRLAIGSQFEQFFGDVAGLGVVGEGHDQAVVGV
jgi:hypothetical protein